jgi:Uma2 family endonuclease
MVIENDRDREKLALPRRTDMSTAIVKLITAEEFGKVPEPKDGSKEELVKGVIVTMPPPKGRHGYVQLEIGSILRAFVKPKRLGWVVTESGTVLERDPDTVRGPDVAFYSITRQPTPPEDYFEIAPELAVEVLSPDDRSGKVREKIGEHIAAGVKLVWLVDPDARTVLVYRGSRRGTELDDTESLDGGDVLPGFACKVADFFS